MAERADARVVGWTAQDTPRQVFSPEDEEVTLHARFQFNYRAVYEWYRVEWIAPDGSPYKVVSLRTQFGSHRDIKASLKIRGKMASRMPGLWRARLWLRGRKGAPDRLLISRLFRIAEPTPEMLASGLAAVDAPPASTERPLAPRTQALIEPETSSSGAGVRPTPVTVPARSPPTPQANEDGVLLPPLAVLRPPPALQLRQGAGDAAAVAASGRKPASAVSPVGVGTTGKVGTSAAPASATATGELRAPPAVAGLASVTLTSKPAAPGTPLRKSFRRSFTGCPPLYYPPGPGCIEQAPEE